MHPPIGPDRPIEVDEDNYAGNAGSRLLEFDFDAHADDCRRLVACWNACVGVETRDLADRILLGTRAELAKANAELDTVSGVLAQKMLMNAALAQRHADAAARAARLADRNVMMVGLVERLIEACRTVLTHSLLPRDTSGSAAVFEARDTVIDAERRLHEPLA